MAKNTSDVVKNLKGQGQEYYSNKPMEKGGTIKLGSRSKFKAGAGKDFKTPQWMKDIGEGVEFVGDKIGEAFPKKGWTEVNTQQAVLGGLPLLAGLAFGGTRGAAIGGQVGLKALEDIRKGREDAFDRNVELKKLQLQEQGQKERLRYLEAQLGLRSRGLDIRETESERQARIQGEKQRREKRQEKIKTAGGLRREFQKLTSVADMAKIRDSYKGLLATPVTAAGDLSLIFKYMKMLDPGSTVREGEFANAENAKGIEDSLRALYNKIKTPVN